VQACINRIGIGFLFAPLYHPAMKFAAKPRAELGVRSIFNILGPLTNPAGVQRQIIGTYHQRALSLLAGALRELGVEKGCVVHSDDGLDEVTLSGGTNMQEVNRKEQPREYHLQPEDFGFSQVSLDGIRGGDKNANAVITMNVLKGEKGTARDVVVANAALGIYVSGKVNTILEGKVKAEESINSGKALEKLQKLIQYTDQP
jgi:anthranilate phosphoribosyltransferase